MQPVDVYYEWIDACEDVNENGGSGGAGGDAPEALRPTRIPAAGARAGLAPGEKVTDEDRAFLDDADDMDAAAEYDDE